MEEKKCPICERNRLYQIKYGASHKEERAQYSKEYFQRKREEINRKNRERYKFKKEGREQT